MWCSGPVWGSWGLPWGMFFMPVFFVLAMVFLFIAFRRGMIFCGCHGPGHVRDSSGELLDELRRLRQEVEKLRAADQK